MAKIKPETLSAPSSSEKVKKKPFKSAKIKNKTKFNSKEPEALDIGLEAETGEKVNLDFDSQEISDFVSKLGLSKFSNGLPISPAAKTKNLKKSSSKDLKLKNQNETPQEEEKTPFVKKSSKKSKDFNPNKTEIGNSTSPSNNKTNKTPNKKSKKKQGSKSQQKNAEPKLKMIIKPEGKWFEDELADKEKSTETSVEENGQSQQYQRQPSQNEIIQAEKTANGLLEADIQAYKSSNIMGRNKSDFEWMEKMMRTGTLPDRMAAFIVKIQNSPIHNLNYLQQLTSMVKVQGKQQCLMTADTLRDLFLEDLLPQNRKLIPFSRRGSQLNNATKKQLIQWIFEDKLKTHYENFVQALKRMAGDTVEKLRGKAIVIIFQLLVAHPEQESSLLEILVNKLGDPAKKLGSRALFYLNNLLREHPKMKLIVIEEVERLIFRQNISKRAQYYGICFLNLIKLDGEHASLAHKLITVYVAFFKASVKTGDIDSKMMSGLLTGINRAFPQAREFGFKFTENLDTLYKIVQLSQFPIAVQSLSILFQITDVAGNPDGADRFYRVLYEKLLDVEFLTTSHNIQFLNLIFSAVKSDNDINRVTGFAKRLLQICQNCPPNLACAILFLLSEVSVSHPDSLKIGNLSTSEIEAATKREENEIESSDSESEEQVSKKNVDLNELMKSTNIRIDDKPEPEESDVQSKAKKSAKKSLKETLDNETNEIITIDESETASPKGDDDEEDIKEIKEEKPDVKRLLLTEYNPQARNPKYCGAELSLAYELTSLARHFHPSVSLFAQTLLKRKNIKYDGNPLKDFTLPRFLERFAYRNAKKPTYRFEYQPKGLRSVPVNSENYLQAEEDKIPVEEKFFYRYFKSKKESTSAIKEEDEDVSDAESVDDDEFDDLMKNYFKSTNPSGDDSDEEVDSDEENIDYVAGVSALKGKSKKRKQDDESDNEDDAEQEDSDGGADDDADDFICMDEEGEDFENSDDDEIGMIGFDDEDEEEETPKKKRKALSGGDLFAPAEQFAEMLEENAEENFSGSQTLINKDRASHKQLKWETEKDRWVKGYTGKNSKKAYKGGNKKRMKRK